MSAAEMLAGAVPGRAPNWYSLEGKTVWRAFRRHPARIVKAAAKAARGAKATPLKAVKEQLAAVPSAHAALLVPRGYHLVANTRLNRPDQRGGAEFTQYGVQ